MATKMQAFPALWIALYLSFTVRADIKFPKDRRMDVQFPSGISLPAGPGLPIGHLRPLGHQRVSSGVVTEADNVKNLDQHPMLGKRVFTDERLWDMKSTARRESARVSVRQKKSDGLASLVKLNLARFADNFDGEDWVMSALLPKDMVDQVQVPAGFDCAAWNLVKVEVETSAWTTSDVITGSRFAQLQCLTSGKRDYIIADLENAVKHPPITQHGPCETLFTVDVNADMVNVFDFPWVTSMSWQHATLLPGDCLYIPPGFAVHSTSYGEICEVVNFFWNPKRMLDDCDGDDIENIRPVICADDVTGNQTLCEGEGKISEEQLRKLLIQLVDQEGKLSKKCFDGVAKHLLQAESEQNLSSMFNALGSETPTDTSITALTKAELKVIIDLANPKIHSHDEL